METEVLDIKGESVGKVSLDENIFSSKLNKFLVHEAVEAHLAADLRPFLNHCQHVSRVRSEGRGHEIDVAGKSVMSDMGRSE